MKTSQSNPMTSWDELLAALDNASINTYDALWQIYWYDRKRTFDKCTYATYYVYVYARKATDGS